MSQSGDHSNSAFDEATVGVLSGQQLGPYRIDAFLGRGGMGEVYRAEHQHLKRSFAIKVILPTHLNSRDGVNRFYREMEAVGALTHPNLVLATDGGCVDERHYLAMEFVEGQTLTQLVKSYGPLPVGVACHVICQAAAGLGYAHQQGVVHRDVKPGNMMLTSEGVVKVLDLGLARMAGNDGAASTELTLQNQIMGTPDYIAPEQARDSREATAQSDIYSLGCTLFYLLVGRAPFDDQEHDTALKKVLAHQNEDFPKLESFREDLPVAITELLAAMTAPETPGRLQSAEAVIEGLEPFTDADAVCELASRLPHQKVSHPAEIDTSNARELESTEAFARPNETAQDKVRRPAKQSPEDSQCLGIRKLGLVVAAGAVFLAALAFALFSWPSGFTPDAELEAGVKVSNSSARADLEQGPQTGATASVSIRQFDVNHFRFSETSGDDLGIVGQESFHAEVGDDVRIKIQLRVPAYGYLFAVNPDGSVQLCWPEEPTSPPIATDQIEMYPDPQDYFTMTEGVGRQAFILVLAGQPLPAWNQWWKGGERMNSWPTSAGVWRFRDDAPSPLFPQSFSTPRGQRVTRGPQAFVELCRRLTSRDEIVVVDAISFPVVAGPSVPSGEAP